MKIAIKLDNIWMVKIHLNFHFSDKRDFKILLFYYLF
jgi:hypothetical protein